MAAPLVFLAGESIEGDFILAAPLVFLAGESIEGDFVLVAPLVFLAGESTAAIDDAMDSLCDGD